jgi:hypothetical protein
MNNLLVKQILQQKDIPEEIEEEIVKYLPLPEQEKKKKEMIRKMNIWYHNYWYPDCWTPRCGHAAELFHQIVGPPGRKPPRVNDSPRSTRDKNFLIKFWH